MSEFEYGLFGSQGELVGRTYRREDQARYEMGNAALAWKVTLELRRREIGPWVSLPVERMTLTDRLRLRCDHAPGYRCGRCVPCMAADRIEELERDEP